jgi:hypothetical protein
MGAYTEIVDYTWAADETSRTFSGLSITEDDFIKVVMTFVNNVASEVTIRCFPNTAAGVSGFDTTTNYHAQLLLGSGTSVVAVRRSANVLNVTSANGTSSVLAYIKMSENGKSNFFTNRLNDNTSTLSNVFDYTTSSNLTFNDPITSLTFSADQTNAIGTGSRIQIYRLDAEKVADITTTENATQVDISSLSIGKDSEYLLVSDIVSDVTGGAIRLMVNDNTTETDYYSQGIVGNDSSASASRSNEAIFQIIRTGRNLGYAHIKLSEIGAYTAQTYNIELVGDSGIQLRNYFISSTSEAITSITKLNIQSGVADKLLTGTRFILYKLK